MAGVSFDRACGLIESALRGPARVNVLADALAAKDLAQASLRLRASMRGHTWKAGDAKIDLGEFVAKYDRKTRHEGFHVLNDWDGKADHVNADIIPVDVLDYLVAQRGAAPPDATALAILVDYYFLHILSLLSLRIWDEGDPDANLDRLNDLLRELQGPHGSGQRFVDDAETLILIATSHFEMVERGYVTLLEQTKQLNRPHRVSIALAHCVSMGSHLRFGFEASYGRDTVVMRDDNVADYPWLCFALLTMMQEYAQLTSEGADTAAIAPIVEGVLNGLSADARAFVGQPPTSLSQSARDRAEFRALFHAHQDALLEAFQPYRPDAQTYSPLCFFFNFSHNVLKGMVVDALLRGEAWPLTFNDMLTSLSRADDASAAKLELAATLMGYARANPDTIRGRPMPVIVYDPATGRDAFAVTLRKIKE